MPKAKPISRPDLSKRELELYEEVRSQLPQGVPLEFAREQKLISYARKTALAEAQYEIVRKDPENTQAGRLAMMADRGARDILDTLGLAKAKPGKGGKREGAGRKQGTMVAEDRTGDGPAPILELGALKRVK